MPRQANFTHNRQIRKQTVVPGFARYRQFFGEKLGYFSKYLDYYNNLYLHYITHA